MGRKKVGDLSGEFIDRYGQIRWILHDLDPLEESHVLYFASQQEQKKKTTQTRVEDKS